MGEADRLGDEVIMPARKYEYDVALSFAGEDRNYASALASVLHDHGIKVFYDEYERSTLWGQNLYTYLSDLYQNKARYCVMFLSKHYAVKLWTNHEREAAQARAFQEQGVYILPIRLDDTEIPGVLQTTAYLNWHKETAETIADAVMEKLHFIPSTPQTITSLPSASRGLFQKKISRRVAVLWIGLILLLTTISLGIWGFVTKPYFIISLTASGLAVFALLLGFLQVAPKSLVPMRQDIKKGLFVTGIVFLLGSLVLNLIVLFPRQPLTVRSHNSTGPNTSSTTGPSSTQTFTVTGTPSSVPVTTGRIHEFPIPTDGSKTTGITWGPDGNLWFIEEQGNKIGRITPQGVITEFSIPTPNSISDGIIRGPDGNLWFFENKGDKIGRITPQGKITEFPVQAGSDLVGLTAGPDGNLWFVGYQPNTIWRMTTSGKITGQFPIPTAGSGTETIKAGPDGNVWFVEDWGDRIHPKIGHITPQGIFTEFTIPTPLVPGEQNYHDLITGPDGNLWFTEGLVHKIGRITRQGVITEFSVPPPSVYFGSLCVGPDGNFWFTDGGNYIGRMTTSGVVTNFFSIPTPDSHPSGLTAGPDKNIWFVEVTGNNVGQVRTGL